MSQTKSYWYYVQKKFPQTLQTIGSLVLGLYIGTLCNTERAPNDLLSIPHSTFFIAFATSIIVGAWVLQYNDQIERDK